LGGIVKDTVAQVVKEPGAILETVVGGSGGQPSASSQAKPSAQPPEVVESKAGTQADIEAIRNQLAQESSVAGPSTRKGRDVEEEIVQVREEKEKTEEEKEREFLEQLAAQRQAEEEAAQQETEEVLAQSKKPRGMPGQIRAGTKEQSKRKTG